MACDRIGTKSASVTRVAVEAAAAEATAGAAPDGDGDLFVVAVADHARAVVFARAPATPGAGQHWRWTDPTDAGAAVPTAVPATFTSAITVRYSRSRRDCRASRKRRRRASETPHSSPEMN